MIYELNSFLVDCNIEPPTKDNWVSLKKALDVFFDGNGYPKPEYSTFGTLGMTATFEEWPRETFKFIYDYERETHQFAIVHIEAGEKVSDWFTYFDGMEPSPWKKESSYVRDWSDVVGK